MPAANCMLATVCLAAISVLHAAEPIPKVWMSCYGGGDVEATYVDCRAHGVDVVEAESYSVERCRKALAAARKTGVKLFVGGVDPSEDARTIRLGRPCERAVMIGGAYMGKAVDRYLFAFSAARHEIVVEPPVYSPRQPYRREVKGADGKPHRVRGGHYFEDFEPVRAEVVVPLSLFDGKQHLAVVPAEMRLVPSNTKVENDSVKPEMAEMPEIRERRIVSLSFDLSSFTNALLDKIGIAVYWRSVKDPVWEKERAHLSPFSSHTRAAARCDAIERLDRWKEANGGTFPSDTVVGFRFGDETFNVSGHLGSSACSYPLWDYSDSALAAFASAVGDGTLAPRTWGFPEIYGSRAYAVFLYGYHAACARLVRACVDAVHGISPGMHVFRNTTRGSVWTYMNDHDGTGQELLVRELDIVHLDPYPVSDKYSDWMIPGDMAYMSGLARRYGKPIMPWLQAHSYAPNGLRHVTPEDVSRMYAQHGEFAPDALMWLTYDTRRYTTATFPNCNPASWERAREIHAAFHAKTSWDKPKARLAVLRPYSMRALVCEVEQEKRWAFRNPADVLLGSFVKAWSVRFGRQYDVFEIPPDESPGERDARDRALAQYDVIASTVPYPRARVIGAGTEGTVMTTAQMHDAYMNFVAEIENGKWQ